MLGLGLSRFELKPNAGLVLAPAPAPPNYPLVAGGACFWASQNCSGAACLSSLGARLGKRPPLSPFYPELLGQEVHKAQWFRCVLLSSSVQVLATMGQAVRHLVQPIRWNAHKPNSTEDLDGICHPMPARRL